MITETILQIVRLGLDLAENIMRDDPDVDTTETEQAIEALRDRLDKYKAARAELEKWRNAHG